MEKRRIGRSDLWVAPLILGGNVFGWTADRSRSFAILDAFFDAGFNAVDTADIYSNWVEGHFGGESESMIGEWLSARGRRQRVILATKIGAVPRTHEEGGAGRGWAGDLSARHLIEAVEQSLRRLRTDYIDLCQSHISDDVTPMEETLEAYDQLILAGKVRVVGASNHNPAALSRALRCSRDQDLPRYESLQTLYNLSDRTAFEEGLQQVCVDNDVGVLCYASLARGFLTGKYRAAEDAVAHPWEARVRSQVGDRGDRILSALDKVAAERNANQAEVALAWLRSQPGVTAPIAAVNSVEELNEIVGGARLTLSAEEITFLSNAGAP